MNEQNFKNFFQFLQNWVVKTSFEDKLKVNLIICAVIVAYMIFDFLRNSKESPEVLRALGLLEPDGSCKVRMNRKGNKLVFKRVPIEALERSFWEKNFESLSNYFKEEIVDILFKQNKYHNNVELVFNRLPDSIPFDLSEIKLKPMDVYLGVNQFGKEVIINLMSNSSIYIDGKPGSGKTVAIKALIESYAASMNYENIEVFVVSTKTADFNYLRSRTDIKATIVNIFDPNISFDTQVNKIITSFKDVKDAQKEFNEAVEANHLTDAGNIEKLRQMGLEINYPRRIYLFDEAKDYLSKDKADDKEEAELKSLLIKEIKIHIRRNARFLSTPIIVAAQVQNENELDIPLKTFHLRIASSTNESMSRLITGGSKILTNPSFTKGKFYLKTATEDHIFRVPFYQ